MKGAPGKGLLLIHCPVRCLEPPPRYFPFGYFRTLHLSLARRLNRYVRTDILEDDDPVGVLLVDLRPEMEREGTRDLHVLRKRVGHVPQLLHRPGLAKRHLSKTIRSVDAVPAGRGEGFPS